MVTKAIIKAVELHNGQIRKGGGNAGGARDGADRGAAGGANDAGANHGAGGAGANDAALDATDALAADTPNARPIPYIVHPLEVGFIVSRYSSSPEFIAAAILHDTVEDCDYTITQLEKDFGPEVKELVSRLSEDKSIKDWSERKQENLKRLRENRDALFIKSADALANMNSLIEAIREEGPEVWSRFNAGKAQKLAYFRAILDASEEFLPRKHLEEIVSAIKDLEYSESWETPRQHRLGFLLR
jgi:(p)ppGpp synthase/HD superfamily hydrolase